MTRVNLIPPVELTDQHLMAEYRELPMVVAAFRRTLNSKNGYDPRKNGDMYTLGTGHVRFFYNKMAFLQSRYQRLHVELKCRNYNLDRTRIFPTQYLNEDSQLDAWQPRIREIRINAQRIYERIQEKPEWYRWHGKPLHYYTNFIENFARRYL